MALIFDPDNLNQGVEVTFDTSAKTIALNIAGNLSTDGVTLKALYSFCKEEWKNDPALIPFPFPFTPITDESFELKDGWNFLNDASRYLIRTAGWAVVNTSGAVTERWAGIIGLGFIESDDQLYFDQGAGATNVQLTGQVNQAVQVYSDPNGDGNLTDGFDRRTKFELYAREQGQLYSVATLATIGVATMAPIAYRFPISTGADLKISESDANIDANAPYTGMSITYYATPQPRLIGGSSYNFGVIIDGNNGTAEQIYEFVQRQLRKATDIDANAGGVTGLLADALLLFVGNSLETLNSTNPAGGGTGVFIDNFQASDTNRLSFRDNTAPTNGVTFPFVAVTTLNFNGNLQNDTAAIYRVFYTTNPAGNYGTSNAVLVHANARVVGTDISFTASNTITTGGSVDFTVFPVGSYVHIEGSAGNDGYYEVAARTATTITTVEPVTTEAAGPSISVSRTAIGDVNGNSSVQFDFDYDNNVQGGRSNGTDANITVVAIGLQTGQYVSATGTITRSTQNSVSLVAPLERNYENP